MESYFSKKVDVGMKKISNHSELYSLLVDLNKMILEVEESIQQTTNYLEAEMLEEKLELLLDEYVLAKVEFMKVDSTYSICTKVYQ
jgi:hypothetical protein